MNAHEIIIRPIITEKTMRQNSEDNKISFEVAKGANKTAVAIAIEQTRELILFATIPDFTMYLTSLGAGILSAVLGIYCFIRMRPGFADVL